MQITVIIVAGGAGSRMGGEIPKQFMLLAGRPILVRTLERMHEALPDSEVIVVLPASEQDKWAELCAEYRVLVEHQVCSGGANRFESVRNGVNLAVDAQLIAVHDGVRPLASVEMIRQAVAVACECGSAIPVVVPVDSFRAVGEDGRSLQVDRSELRAVQTPQIFDAENLRLAYRQPYNPHFTDDASVVESCGFSVTLCCGEQQNIKITTPLDLTVAQAIIGAQSKK